MSEDHKVYVDASGIVIADYRFASLAATPQSVGRTRAKIAELCPGRKVPLLVLVDVAHGMGPELADAVRQMDAVVTKVAVVTPIAAARKLAGDFREVAKLPFPQQAFENEADARAWLLSPES